MMSIRTEFAILLALWLLIFAGLAYRAIFG